MFPGVHIKPYLHHKECVFNITHVFDEIKWTLCHCLSRVVITKWCSKHFNWVIFPLTQPQVATQKKNLRKFFIASIVHTFCNSAKNIHLALLAQGWYKKSSRGIVHCSRGSKKIFSCIPTEVAEKLHFVEWQYGPFVKTGCCQTAQNEPIPKIFWSELFKI